MAFVGRNAVGESQRGGNVATGAVKAKKATERGGGSPNTYKINFEVDIVGGGAWHLSRKIGGGTTLDEMRGLIREEAEKLCNEKQIQMLRIDNLIRVWPD